MAANAADIVAAAQEIIDRADAGRRDLTKDEIAEVDRLIAMAERALPQTPKSADSNYYAKLRLQLQAASHGRR